MAAAQFLLSSCHGLHGAFQTVTSQPVLMVLESRPQAPREGSGALVASEPHLGEGEALGKREQGKCQRWDQKNRSGRKAGATGVH